VAVTLAKDGIDRGHAQGRSMTDHANMKSHMATYTSVMGLMKWGAVACFLIGAAVVWLIAS
jgi:hypothetical protein